MYRQENTAAAIERIQDYLYEIYQNGGISNPTVRDGIYGEQTRTAVIEFQNRNGLEANGIVDLETFDALRASATAYKEKNEQDEYLYSQNGYPLRFGTSGADVDVLHALLRSISEYRRDLPPIPRSSYYSNETENAVRYMERVFLMNESGIVSAALFKRLENDLEAMRAFSDLDFG